MKVFEKIYQRNAWNGVESLSGPGSGRIPTLRVSEAILDIVRDCDVQSVLDIGCGDGYWMPQLPGYYGVDASTTAINAARKRHPDLHYEVVNAAKDRLPVCDLVIIRDALQHLSIRDALAVVRNAQWSGARLLLASTYEGGSNENIPNGSYRYGPDLTAKPFFLPEPDELIFDGYGYEHPDEVRDPGKYLGLWSL